MYLLWYLLRKCEVICMLNQLLFCVLGSAIEAINNAG